MADHTIPAADWVARTADEVIAEADRREPGGTIVCASGLSPSGPVHLGNLREVMTPHLVADEIRRRGRSCRHLLSWDDYDRFRRVPAGYDPALADHIGRPLTAVPAPAGSDHPNWAEHFKAPLAAALAELGIEYDPISQTRKYTSGAYTDQVLTAMAHREKIGAILDRYRTKDRDPDADDDGAPGATFFPFKPYCSSCGRDTTTARGYREPELDYDCSSCGNAETVRLTEFHGGKLVWKVDWPMRWAYEHVVFEPSGVDHTSPGSSFQVGGQIIGPVFGGEQPIGPRYAFVGISGMAKMSSSRGAVPTPGDALAILEPPLLRWLYARRRPNQAFTIGFGPETQRLYDEWDALSAKVRQGTAPPADAAAFQRAGSTAAGTLPSTPVPLPFRLLASVVDVTAGDEAQVLRVLREADPDRPIDSPAAVRPRLDKAAHWVATQVPDESRTRVRDNPDTALLSTLDDGDRESLSLLRDGLADHWSLDGLTTLVYGVPKRRLGLPLDAAPTPELKVSQRAFFVLLYTLLVGRDTGPRLPTLLLAIGEARARSLLGG